MVKKLMESRRTLRNVLIGSLSLLLDRDLMRLLPSFSLLLCLPFFSLFLFLARPAADHSAHTPIITPFQYLGSTLYRAGLPWTLELVAVCEMFLGCCKDGRAP